MTPEKKGELIKQVLDANLHHTDEIPDWALLGVYWTRDGKPIATLENDPKGNPFNTNPRLRPKQGQYTDARGRVQIQQRDPKHFACRNCGVMVQWRQNKAGKWYTAPTVGNVPFHQCLPAWRAWYELQKDAIARVTNKLAERGLKITAETLGEVVDPTNQNS